MNPLVAYSGQWEVGSWGWRHSLAWQQISALWGLQVQEESQPDLNIPACAYSLAMDAGNVVNLMELEDHLAAAPTVVFLNHIELQTQGCVKIEKQEDRTPPGARQHRFKVSQESPLTHGLPGEVITFGPLADITPLPAESGLQVLVWLDGLPIIGYRAPHLLVGADPWQLGNPSVPMLYAVLLNWLSTVVGIQLHAPTPLAAIRLDDLPVTAYELLQRNPTPSLDRRRAAILRRLRKFASRSSIRLSLMYTSHYYTADGTPMPIGDAMPLSIREMRRGIAQKAFEIGAHGMIHLRHARDVALQNADPWEFIDLDEEGTTAHLNACLKEIARLFDTQPASFVAPAWGYRPGVTKKIASKQFNAIIDSSQHMEDGSAMVFSMPGEESPAFNCTETFRPSSRMLSYTSPAFWKCYALAGIPIHYMQHIDTNWHLLQSFLSDQTASAGHSKSLVKYMQDAGKPLSMRALASGWLLILLIWRNPDVLEHILKLLTCSSLYAMLDAMRAAGYRCVGLSEFSKSISEFRRK